MQATEPKIYCIDRCTTCKKAFKWLSDNHVEYEKIDVYDNPPTYEELLEYFKESPLPSRRFFNTSGVVYREMKLKDKVSDMNDEERAKLLASDGRLIKRPLLVTKDQVIPGFNEKLWEEALVSNEG